MTQTIYRKDKIINLCKGKTVLHLGFIQHENLYKKKIDENDWLHSQLEKVATKLVGIDYLSNVVESIRKEFGYEVYSADIQYLENLNFDNTFDVIVCGELIEHIENPGLMLDGLIKFFHKDTIFIITTPNPWRSFWIKQIKSGILEDQWLNTEHVAWYSFQTLKQLLNRKGYSEISYGYYSAETSPSKSTTHLLKRFLQPLYQKIKTTFSKTQCQEGLFFVCKLNQ